MKESIDSQNLSASEHNSAKSGALGGWRGAALGRMRKLIHEAAPDIVEEWKWMGTPVWPTAASSALANPTKTK